MIYFTIVNGIEHRYGDLSRSPDELRKVAEESMKSILDIIREEIKGGRKPEIPQEIKENINETIENVLNQP